MSQKLNPSPKVPNGTYPELSPNPKSEEGFINGTNEQPNTQIVNEPKRQNPSGFDLDDIIALIQKYAPEFDPSTLNGKYVRIMNAPSSTTLTDEQIAQIKEGVFINGDFLGYHNPILTPCVPHNDAPFPYGFIIGGKGGALGGTAISNYNINMSTKIIYEASGINLTAWSKKLPSYPANTAIGHYICRKGTLEWYIPVAQNNITSGDVVALTSNLGKALIDHLEVEINGYRARYEYTDGNYVIYSSKAEVDSGLKLQINMISYNTTNGELSFNQMTFTPDN